MFKSWKSMTVDEKIRSIRNTNQALIELQEGEPDDRDLEKEHLDKYEAKEMSQYDLR